MKRISSLGVLVSTALLLLPNITAGQPLAADQPASSLQAVTPGESAAEQEPLAEGPVSAPSADAPPPQSDESASASEGSPDSDEGVPVRSDQPGVAPLEATPDEQSEEDGDRKADAPEESSPEEPIPGEVDWNGLIERSPAFLALMHHAAVHLPIALWLFGAFFVVLGVVAPSLRNQIPAACLIGGALSSVFAAASGWWYAEHEWGEPWDGATHLRDIDWSEQLTQHRWAGVALAIASCVLSLVAIISLARGSFRLGILWRIGLIGLALAVAWEGHIGGELIHGKGFLEEAYQAWINPDAP
ncbi:hypothetical protein [Botrimarina hoheduenensis]|uniref:Uncharacterized protein n=1 Tax=Botrimarina hoheduenensis TaxID=2528000 RepID=A0A5C5W9Z3_9BACT|nr:hypothetical protein [Botrimarina hoheduenensis]TWT47698.1 hypothetical protein Pla111_13180 [Botrimarina hoheduenensis]